MKQDRGEYMFFFYYFDDEMKMEKSLHTASKLLRILSTIRKMVKNFGMRVICNAFWDTPSGETSRA